MAEDVYHRLAGVLDTLPNGFPSTGSGIELRILRKVFEPEEADLFCDLRLSFETPVQIAERTGRPLEGLDELLTRMWREKGQLQGAELGPTRVFRMLPWVIGIWEMQIDRMDEEFARLSDEYYAEFGRGFFAHGPSLMRTIPVEQEVTPVQQTMPYDRVAGIVEAGKSFAVNDCVCNAEQKLAGRGCDKPSEVCLAIAPLPGIFERQSWGRPISKEEAYAVLRKGKEAGLVHLTSNVSAGHAFICNCCGCCCAVLRGINKLGMTGVVNSDFYSDIDAGLCTLCGMCGAQICQVDAIHEGDGTYEVDRALCIGCALCLESCPVEAIELKRKSAAEIVPSPSTTEAWGEERGRARGVDYTRYR